jgi:hypothetical protein
MGNFKSLASASLVAILEPGGNGINIEKLRH